jgi:hypothetical protein
MQASDKQIEHQKFTIIIQYTNSRGQLSVPRLGFRAAVDTLSTNKLRSGQAPLHLCNSVES